VNHLQPGDRVEWIGPTSDDPDIPQPGEEGVVLSIDPPGEWVVHFDEAGTAVYLDRHIRKIATE
jgi:hypothetical protein